MFTLPHQDRSHFKLQHDKNITYTRQESSTLLSYNVKVYFGQKTKNIFKGALIYKWYFSRVFVPHTERATQKKNSS